MSLERFEAACFRRQLAEAVRVLPSALYGVTAPRSGPNLSPPGARPAPLARLATRFVSAFLALLLDPAVKADDELLTRLVPFLDEVDRLMLASGFAGGDHALRLIAAAAAGPGEAGDPAARARFHLLHTLDSDTDYDIVSIFDEPPALALLLALKHLATKPVITIAGQERRERLLAAAHRLEPAPLPDTLAHVGLLAKAWMDCSYAAHPRKHEIKRTLNAVARDWAQRRGLADAHERADRRRERPLMIVACERIQSSHVQYRYFGQWFRQLRRRFELVLVAQAEEIDAHNRALFDDVLAIERDASGRYFAQIARFIAERRADIVFYPSVGMRDWGIVLANLRLAPIQFTALGHSASTFCPTVDYFVIERGYVGAAELMSEKLILLEDDDLCFEPPPAYRATAPHLRENPQPLRIALAANILKLNPAFLQVCATIAARSGRALEFHVFPSARGSELAAMRRSLDRNLPRAFVHPAFDSPDYLRRLNACDLSLSPWPFGGLHSVVDALRQGLPVVAMEGLEPHGRTDAFIIRRLGLPDFLICRDEAAYVATALRLIENDALRLEVGRQALACNIDSTLFAGSATPAANGIADSIWAMYRHHDRIQADPRRVWTRADLAALDGG